MNDRKALTAQSLTWLLLIPISLLILYLVVDFGQQVIIFHQQNQEVQQLDEQIAAAIEEQARLERDLAYAHSDEAAEKWARALGWARPNEVPVVPVGPDMASPDEEEQRAEPVAGPATPQEAWWDLFFAARNPVRP